MTAPSLDGRSFDLVSSTASTVDPADRTRFVYSERDGVLWGEYTGGVVTLGRFVGTREGDRLTISFVHLLVVGGDPVAGQASSRIQQDTDGLRLVEDFEVDGAPQVSICVEVPAPAR